MQAVHPHVSKRSNLVSFLCFIVLSGEGELRYEGEEFKLHQGDCVFIDCRKAYSHSTFDNLWSLQWCHFYAPSLPAVYEKYKERGGRPVFHLADYSIHDAIEAGFNHVVFIIRKDIEKEFKEVIGDRIAAICSAHNVTVDYAFQDIKDIPGTLPEGRTKPWGTGQAVLAAKKVIKTPFIVINADDYYSDLQI